ncbi:MAG TPA: pitrilysin family protein [Phycisphaerae bacterium]
MLTLCGAALAGKYPEPESFPKEPPVGPLPEVASLPKTHGTKLDNGMEVIVVSNSEIPWVAVSWYSLDGARFDPPAKAGLASTTAAMLRKGTQSHTDGEISELLDWNAVSLSAGADHDTTTVSADGPSKALDVAVRLVAEVARTPVFPAKEFRQHLQQTITGLSVAEGDGGYLADREFRQRIYGTHYLARLPSGTTRTLPAVHRDDCIEFHKTHYMPNRSLLIFSGDVDERRAVDLAKSYFGDWQPGTPAAEPDATIPSAGETHVVLVDRPDSTQSQIRVGQVGFTRSDPRYVLSQVFNQYFGGGFSSRLNRAVRVKEGLTYGAGGGFSAGKQPGTFSLHTFTKNETTAETVRVLLGEVHNALTVPPTTEELDDAKSYMIGRFALSMETPQEVASKVFELKFYGLPDDYFTSFYKQVRASAADDIFGFAQSAILPEKLTIVVVGKAEQVKAPLSEIAPVTVVHPDEEKPAD